jgi:hypothetical protein
MTVKQQRTEMPVRLSPLGTVASGSIHVRHADGSVETVRAGGVIAHLNTKLST